MPHLSIEKKTMPTIYLRIYISQYKTLNMRHFANIFSTTTLPHKMPLASFYKQVNWEPRKVKQLSKTTQLVNQESRAKARPDCKAPVLLIRRLEKCHWFGLFRRMLCRRPLWCDLPVKVSCSKHFPLSSWVWDSFDVKPCNTGEKMEIHIHNLFDIN